MAVAISIYTIHDIYLFYKIPSVKYVFALCKLSGNLKGSSSDKCDGLLFFEPYAHPNSLLIHWQLRAHRNIIIPPSG